MLKYLCQPAVQLLFVFELSCCFGCETRNAEGGLASAGIAFLVHDKRHPVWMPTFPCHVDVMVKTR
jgi:hypothetical protein